MSFFEVAHAHSKASNKNSAMAVSGGLSYSPSLNGDDAFDLPLPYFFKHELLANASGNKHSVSTCEPMYGVRNFRLTVLGLAKDASSRSRAKYVCKCSCGMYCYRTAKQMRTGINQACGVCQKNFVRTRRDMGGSKVVTDSQVWQRMGGA